MPMEISRTDAVAICVALGFKTAKSWNQDRMTDKVNKLGELFDEGARIPDEFPDAERLGGVLEDIATTEDGINVVQKPGDKPPATKKTSTRSTKKKTATGGKDDKPAASTKKTTQTKKKTESGGGTKKTTTRGGAGKSTKATKKTDPKPEVSDADKLQGKRPRGRERLIACGRVLKELGMKNAKFELVITPELIAKVDELVGNENEVQTEAGLVQAWSALRGFYGAELKGD